MLRRPPQRRCRASPSMQLPEGGTRHGVTRNGGAAQVQGLQLRQAPKRADMQPCRRPLTWLGGMVPKPADPTNANKGGARWSIRRSDALVNSTRFLFSAHRPFDPCPAAAYYQTKDIEEKNQTGFHVLS